MYVYVYMTVVIIIIIKFTIELTLVTCQLLAKHVDADYARRNFEDSLRRNDNTLQRQ